MPMRGGMFANYQEKVDEGERERDTVRVNGLSLEGKNVSMLVRVKEKERMRDRERERMRGRKSGDHLSCDMRSYLVHLRNYLHLFFTQKVFRNYSRFNSNNRVNNYSAVFSSRNIKHSPGMAELQSETLLRWQLIV